MPKFACFKLETWCVLVTSRTQSSHWSYMDRLHLQESVICVLVYRWIPVLACGRNVPSYSRLCPNLFTISFLWYWPHKENKFLQIQSSHNIGRLTVPVITQTLGKFTFLAINLFLCWFGQLHNTCLGHWLHMTYRFFWPYLNTLGFLTVLVRILFPITPCRLGVLVTTQSCILVWYCWLG